MLGYGETDIISMLKGRRAFSEKEIQMLILGRYMPANVPKLTLKDSNAFISQLKAISKERGINYLPAEFFNISLLNQLKNQWTGVKLGTHMDEIEEEIGVPFKVRAEQIKTDQKELEKILKEESFQEKQELKEKANEMKERARELKDKTSSAPIGTPGLDSEIFTASRVSPTFSGSQVNQQTGLTGTQEALLNDPLDKLIAKKQNQGIASLA